MARLGITISGLFILAAAVFPVKHSFAQNTKGPEFNPADIRAYDSAGTNLLSGYPEFNVTPVSIGGEPGGLSLVLSFEGAVSRNLTFADKHQGRLERLVCRWDAALDLCKEIMVTGPGVAERFAINGNGFTSVRANGSSLEKIRDGSYVLTDRTGVKYYYDDSIVPLSCRYPNGYIKTSDFWPCVALKKVEYQNGLVITYYYQKIPRTPPADPNAFPGWDQVRLIRVVSSTGYELRYEYVSDATAGGDGWLDVQNVRGVNAAVDYCDVNLSRCVHSRAWPVAQFDQQGIALPGSGTEQFFIKMSNGATHRYTQQRDALGTARVTAMKLASSPSQDTATYKYISPQYCYQTDQNGGFGCTFTRTLIVKEVTQGDSVWTYSYDQPAAGAPPYADLAGIWTTTSVGPDSKTVSATNNASNSQIWQVNSGQASAIFNQNTFNRMSQSVDVEGRKYAYDYDDRGNLTKKIQTSTDGTPSIITSAEYDKTCANIMHCNKPKTITDARQKVTRYTYDDIHGLVRTITQPAIDPIPPATQAISPQQRFIYSPRYSWIKAANGSFVKATAPVWLLTSTSSCRKGAAAPSGSGCALGPSDEVVTTFEYGPDSGPNNLALRGEVTTADGVSLRKCYSYDVFGNKISETSANAALAACP